MQIHIEMHWNCNILGFRLEFKDAINAIVAKSFITNGIFQKMSILLVRNDEFRNGNSFKNEISFRNEENSV